MRALPAPARKQLETAVGKARRAAEAAAKDALSGLGVFLERRPDHLDADAASLRNGLRAKWRQHGGDEAAQQLLVAECAYEQWHRLLFARFLAENGLLRDPTFGAPMTLADCDDVAAELGEPDGWAVASRFAAEILPGIFRLGDPAVRLRLAPEGHYALESILESLPTDTFLADDALGWVYQFWQKDQKDAVNNSGRKIGGADLGPVTQLFTESYMVRFLLENSLGAWWAGRCPDSPLLAGFDYLRLDDQGQPAAGTFEHWPDRVAEVTVMDPCCGSGHFLVEAFTMLWQMRAEEEGLAPVAAQDAVLRDNLFGLELDPRCVQIAMFAVALQAWKAGGGWRRLPIPNVACSGIPVKAPVEEWRALAAGDPRKEAALVRIHALFREADRFGSLASPSNEAEGGALRQRSLDGTDWLEVGPTVMEAVDGEVPDPATAVLGAGATAAARALQLLSASYTVVATNPPFLSARRMDSRTAALVQARFPSASRDLSTAMLMRWTQSGYGTALFVTPQSWLYIAAFSKMREAFLSDNLVTAIGRLGAGAFRSISGEVVNVVLLISERSSARREGNYLVVDVNDEASPERKAVALRTTPALYVDRAGSDGAGNRISTGGVTATATLGDFVNSYTGLQTGDDARYRFFNWEIPHPSVGWMSEVASDLGDQSWTGQYSIVRWDKGPDDYSSRASAHLHSRAAEGRAGVLVRLMGRLPVTLYSGKVWHQNCARLVPSETKDLGAIWAFATSTEFEARVREIDPSLKVTPSSFLRVPFDIGRWRKVAEEAGPLPEPWSDDPTQWLFEGRPEVSTSPLQVAVGRLLGYRWPEQTDDDLEQFADDDGIVCLPSVAGEAPAAERVQQMLAAAYGDEWSPAMVGELLREAGSKKTNVADWLQAEFFKQHCALFGQRPFVWHVWDGLRDGFAALVNYHRLDHAGLQKLTHTYLGLHWVERQREQLRDEVPGADARLAAALALKAKLEAILEGEDPYDVYVRWKPLDQQPIGWRPDLDDGVRLNIRPFVTADVLRSKVNLHWKKDRGANPDGSERLNDRHLSLAEKQAARS